MSLDLPAFVAHGVYTFLKELINWAIAALIYSSQSRGYFFITSPERVFSSKTS